MFFVVIVLICACVVLIVWRVFQTERRLYGPKHIVRRSRMAMGNVERSHRNTKILLYQASAYFLSYMVSMSTLFARIVFDEPLWVIRLSFFFMPLQGFFNALIFISHKVSNYCRVHQDVSRCSAFALLVKGSVGDPLFSQGYHCLGSTKIEEK